MKLGLSLKEECEARMRRSTTRDSSKKRHLRSRHRSSSSSSSSSRSSHGHRSRSKSSSRSCGSRGHHRSKHSGRRRNHSRSGSDRSTERMDRFGRRLNPSNVTNSKDPKAVASRVFLGSLPVDITREDVEARFNKHGKILGITLLQGYGFVQFEEQEEAIRAVQVENLSDLKGNKIDVRLASEHKKKRSSSHGDDSYRKSSREMDYPRPYPPPPRDPYADPYDRGLPPPPHLDPYHRPPHPGDPYAQGPPPPHMDPYHRGSLPPPYHRGPPHPDDPYARGPRYDPFIRGPPQPGDPYRHPPYAEPYPYHAPASYGSSLPPPPPSVDCEIIVLDEKQRSADGQIKSYADGIKRRLMSAGIVTEMNILPCGVDVLTALEEATRRRLLFAIVVNDQNEIHRSITVNILHGLTQEHRNMPVDDAITLVTRSFDKYMLEKQERMSKEGTGPEDSSATKRAPDFLRPTANTLYLLNLLADNRYLTVDELDTVMDYLQVRRDRLLKSQGGAAAAARPVGPVTPPPVKKVKPDDLGPSVVSGIPREPDIKSILGLLQKEKTASIEAAKPVASYSAGSLSAASVLSSTSINFSNAAVQQALDNLILSGPNLLKSLKDVGKAPTSVASTALRPYDDDGTADPYEDFEQSYGAGLQYRGGPY